MSATGWVVSVARPLFESIEQGSEVHGIDADALIADINWVIRQSDTDAANRR